VRAIVAADGGDDALRRCHSALTHLLAERPGAQVIPSAEGAVDATYGHLLSTLAEPRGIPRPPEMPRRG
jgi:hypothetical protein